MPPLFNKLWRQSLQGFILKPSGDIFRLNMWSPLKVGGARTSAFGKYSHYLITFSPPDPAHKYLWICGIRVWIQRVLNLTKLSLPKPNPDLGNTNKAQEGKQSLWAQDLGPSGFRHPNGQGKVTSRTLCTGGSGTRTNPSSFPLNSIWCWVALTVFDAQEGELKPQCPN